MGIRRRSRPGNIVGGESVEFYVSTQNLADASIKGTMWNVVTNPEGVVCAEFTAVGEVLDYNSPYAMLYPEETMGCEVIDTNSVRIISTPDEPWTWSPLHKDIAHITVTFDEAAIGTYAVSSYVKP